MSTIKEKITELNKLIKVRAEMKTKTKIYSSTNSRIQAIKKQLKKEKSLPSLKQSEVQPIFPNMIKSIETPHISDLILSQAIKAASLDKHADCKALLQAYEMVKKVM